jgi:AcrR family transcriptional regulator
VVDELRDEMPHGTRDPAATIKRIMAAAREEFGLNGFDGAKMEHIARRAGVSKQLVYIYFKSKDELYGEMLRAISRETYERLLKVDYAELEPELAVRTYIGGVYDCFASDPVTGVVTMDQSLHAGAQIRLVPEIRRMRATLARKIEDALMRGRTAGLFGAQTDAASLEFMTVIIVSGCVSSRPMFLRYLGYNAFEDESSAFWRNYAASFIMRALRP